MSSWSPTGAIAYLQGGDIWILEQGATPAPFFTSEAQESDATFSPDGRWLAYKSNVSGRQEIYVRPFPGADPAVQVSRDGGVNPAWAPDGRRIFYLQLRQPPPHVLMSVDVELGDAFRTGRPAPLVDPWPALSWTNVRGYDVFADGSFVTDEVSGDPESGVPTTARDRFRVSELSVVVNFFEDLQARLPSP